MHSTNEQNVIVCIRLNIPSWLDWQHLSFHVFSASLLWSWPMKPSWETTARCELHPIIRTIYLSFCAIDTAPTSLCVCQSFCQQQSSVLKSEQTNIFVPCGGWNMQLKNKDLISISCIHSTATLQDSSPFLRRGRCVCHRHVRALSSHRCFHHCDTVWAGAGEGSVCDRCWVFTALWGNVMHMDWTMKGFYFWTFWNPSRFWTEF